MAKYVGPLIMIVVYIECAQAPRALSTYMKFSKASLKLVNI